MIVVPQLQVVRATAELSVHVPAIAASAIAGATEATGPTSALAITAGQPGVAWDEAGARAILLGMAMPARSADRARISPGRRRAARVAPLVVVAMLAGVVGAMVGWSATDGTEPPAAADVGFVVDMLDHHNQAVQIAEFALGVSESPAVLAVAQAVISDQRWEIGWMEAWLAGHDLERPSTDRTVMEWMGMPVPHDAMPGLVPQDELIALFNLEGEAFDRRFLELMLEHHEGGVHMAEWELHHGLDPELRDLAGRMLVKQRSEINDLSLMLT